MGVAVRPAHTGRVCRCVLEHKIGMMKRCERTGTRTSKLSSGMGVVEAAPLFTCSLLPRVTQLRSMAHARIATGHEAKRLKILEGAA